jgi:hypothetical protein
LAESKISDPRDNRGRKYSISDAILSVVLMFLLKEGSRHSYNQDRAEPLFAKNIKNILKVNLLHGDSFNDILSIISEDDLEELKASLIKSLIKEGVLLPNKLGGRFIVAVDGTGTHSYDHDYSGNCLYKTSKTGITSYSHAVLEAKLVNEDGFCLSLASEWIENEEKGFEKQDCEAKAFKRLAQKVGRIRWMIENEGFNTQKNLGYGLEHKYSRTSYQATKNYYQCLQIAHLTEQVCLIRSAFKTWTQRSKITLIKLSERLRNMLIFLQLPDNINQPEIVPKN